MKIIIGFLLLGLVFTCYGRSIGASFEERIREVQEVFEENERNIRQESGNLRDLLKWKSWVSMMIKWTEWAMQKLKAIFPSQAIDPMIIKLQNFDEKLLDLAALMDHANKSTYKAIKKVLDDVINMWKALHNQFFWWAPYLHFSLPTLPTSPRTYPTRFTTVEPPFIEETTPEYVTESPEEETTVEPVTESQEEETTVEPVTESRVEETTEEPVTESPEEETTAEPVTESPVEETTPEPVTESPEEETTAEPEEESTESSDANKEEEVAERELRAISSLFSEVERRRISLPDKEAAVEYVTAKLAELQQHLQAWYDKAAAKLPREVREAFEKLREKLENARQSLSNLAKEGLLRAMQKSRDAITSFNNFVNNLKENFAALIMQVPELPSADEKDD